MIAVDLFAGCGGMTEGATRAGVSVAWAANHWPLAVQTHARNHPGTAHACQDLQQQDWREVPDHDLLLASPACQGHTPARGKDRPHHDASRSTAWAVVSCLEAKRPALGLIENVPGFRRWPLYPAWQMAIQALGYSVAEHIVDAADCGVPQHRRRLFLVLARAGRPLHVRLAPQQHRPVASVLDFEAGSWARIDRPGRAATTLSRIEAGRRDHGPRFVVSYYGSTVRGRSIDLPIGTLTTRDRWALVDGDRMRMLGIGEQRAVMGFPVDYHLPPGKDATTMLGNAVCPPVVREIVALLQAVA